MDSGIEELTLSENIRTLDEQCLKMSYLKTLKLCIKDLDMLDYRNSNFGYVGDTELIVPLGSKQVYQEYYPWMEFRSITEYDDNSAPFVPTKQIVKVDNVRYIIENGAATIGRQNKELNGDIVIPEIINYNNVDYPVVGMVSPTDIIAWSDNRVTCENGAFQSCNITSVSLPNTITLLPAGAFNGCKKLINVSLPNTIKGIGAASFAGCSRDRTSTRLHSSH